MAPMVTLRGPGYREIAAELAAEIEAGRRITGEKMPSEAELTGRFGVSRHTIREGLRELAAQGYIQRRQGARSIVVSARPGDRFVNSVLSIEELLQYSTRTLSRLISVDHLIADAHLAERLGVEPGTRWLRAQLLRIPAEGALPIGYSEIYVAERYSTIARRLAESRPVYQLLEDEFDLVFDHVEQLAEAAGATVAVADLLQLPVGAPLLAVRTEFVTALGEIAEIGFGHFPAERYRLEIKLERGASRHRPEALAEEPI